MRGAKSSLSIARASVPRAVAPVQRACPAVATDDLTIRPALRRRRASSRSVGPRSGKPSRPPRAVRAPTAQET